MIQEPPGMERRLILAFLLTLLVLAGWPYLSEKMGLVPHNTGQNTPLISKKLEETGISTPQVILKQEIIGKSATKSSVIGFSKGTAAISEIHIKKPAYQTQPEELILLTPEDGPGFSAIAWQGSLVAWDGWSMAPTPGGQPYVTYQGEPTPGLAAELRYDLDDTGHNIVGWRLTVTNQAAEPQSVQPRLLAGRTLHDHLEQGRYRLLRASVAEKIRTVGRPREPSQRWPGAVRWVTAQTKYYTAVMELATPAAALVATTDVHGQPQAWLEWPTTTIPIGGSHTWSGRLYVGPLDYRFLDDLRLDHAVSLGAFTTVTRLMRSAMLWLSGLFHSYGAAIVTLTVLLAFLFYPLTATSFRTMKRLERLQPELKALQERYKKDPKRLNEEVVKAYRTHRVNPVGGCLPMLLQIPIFIALYQVLNRSPELRGAKFLLIHDLSAPDALIPLPGTLPLVGSAVNVLPLAMAGMMFLQQRMTMRGKTLTEEQRIQQQVFKFMPILFGVMFYTLPSGLVLYWLLNTTLVVLQQRVIARRVT